MDGSGACFLSQCCLSRVLLDRMGHLFKSQVFSPSPHTAKLASIFLTCSHGDGSVAGPTLASAVPSLVSGQEGQGCAACWTAGAFSSEPWWVPAKVMVRREGFRLFSPGIQDRILFSGASSEGLLFACPD